MFVFGEKMKDITVIKFGGSLTKNKEAQKKFIQELAQISKKQNIVLIQRTNFRNCRNDFKR